MHIKKKEKLGHDIPSSFHLPVAARLQAHSWEVSLMIAAKHNRSLSASPEIYRASKSRPLHEAEGSAIHVLYHGLKV